MVKTRPHSGAPNRAGGRTRPGVALLDAIVAAIILGIALAFLMGLAGQAIRSRAQGEELQTAAMLADEQLNLVLARGPDDYGKRFPVRGQCDEPFERFSYQLEFGTATELIPYDVKATISWVSGGETRSIVVETRMAVRSGDDPDPIREPEQPMDRNQ